MGVGITPAQITAVTSGDIDGDGNSDLAAVDDLANGAIGVALGTGGGAYAAPLLSAGTGTTAGAFLLALGDFDLDGVLDAVYSGKDANTAGNPESLFVVGGVVATPGTFNMAAPVVQSINPTAQVTEVCVTDFNGDGEQDVLAATGPDMRIAIWPGAPRLGFAPPIWIGTHGPRITDIDVCVDFNKDGFKDLVSCSEGTSLQPGLVEVFRGRDPSIFPNAFLDPVPAAVIQMPPNTQPVAVHWLECNPGALSPIVKRYDLVVAMEGQLTGLALLPNLGGTFPNAVTSLSQFLPTKPKSAIRLEVNFDGVEDLSVLTFNPQTPTVAPLALSIYSIQDCSLTPISNTPAGMIDTVTVKPETARLHRVGDQNGDGTEDIVTVNHTPPQDRVLVFPNIIQPAFTITPPKPALAQKVSFTFALRAPPALANRPFLVLFGASGTIPGIKVGPGVNLPLNPNLLPLQISGTLNSVGQATIVTPQVQMSNKPEGFSLQIATAFVVLGSAPGSVLFASNPAVVTIP